MPIPFLLFSLIALVVRSSPDVAGEGAGQPESSDASDDSEAVLKRVRAAWKTIEGIEATFVQTSTGMSFFERLVRKGTLALKKPRAMAWTYTSPPPTRYLSDGLSLWVVDDLDKTVTKYPGVDASLGSFFSFVTGEGGLRTTFAVTHLMKGPELREGMTVLELVPKTADPLIEKVFIRVDDSTGLVTSVTVLTPFGDRIDTVLSAIRTDVPLPDERFRWQKQDGYRLLDGG